jgi:hypothetical protein
MKIFQRPDIENKRKAAQLLKAAVPSLKNIRDEHQSERLRKAAAKYLEQIAREAGPVAGKSQLLSSRVGEPCGSQD